MVVCEKALMRNMKDAYRAQGYTVAVDEDSVMTICGGYWLVQIAEEETSNELRSLITLHMRKVPEEGEAYKTIKGDDGPIVQKKLLEEALGPLEHLGKRLAEANETGGANPMRKTELRFERTNVWQNATDLGIFLIDPRYEALLEDKKEVQKAGEGLYAADDISTVWICGVINRAAEEKLKHLAEIRWVAE